MDFIFDKDKLKELHQVISLYKEFDKHRDYTREDLYYHILPSFKLGQYKTFKENNKVIAFANWAFLNDKVEKELVKTKHFNDSDWNSGKIVWIVDVVSKLNGSKVAYWLRNKFKKFKWMRSDQNFKFHRIGKRGY